MRREPVHYMHMNTREEAIAILASGGIGVIPTDTQYGIVTSAFDPDAVERIYQLRRRDPDKPFIILILDVDDLEQFGVIVSDKLREALSAYWPGPASIVLPTADDQFSYLHRGKCTLAFRVPDDGDLRSLLKETGPLVAPSANPAGEPPARTVLEAKQYFGGDIDIYVDGGMVDNPPSAVIDLSTGTPIVLRKPPDTA